MSNIYNIRWDVLRRKNARQRMWQTVNMIVAITLVANVSGLALFSAPKQAQAVGPNLVVNGDFETAGNPGKPYRWDSDPSSSTASTIVTYPTPGKTGQGVKIQVNSGSNIDAKWFFTPIPTVGGHTYSIQFDYMTSTASVATNVTVDFTLANNTHSYISLGLPSASTSWATFSDQLTVPIGVDSFTVYQSLVSVGTLTNDNFVVTDITNGAALNFPRGMITLDFDDTLSSQYSLARPILNTAGVKASFYAITDPTVGIGSDSSYMSWSNVVTLYNDGHEIGAHTQTHPDLTTLNQTIAQHEIADSKTDIATRFGLQNPSIAYTPTTFVYPYGAYNPAIVQMVQDAGYVSARSVADGFNYPSTNKFALLDKHIESTTQFDTIGNDDIKGWIDQAIANKTWLILELHDQCSSTQQCNSLPDQYHNSTTVLQSIVTYIKQKSDANQLKIVTQGEGTAWMDPTTAKVLAHEALTKAFATYTQGNYTALNWATLVAFKTDGDAAIDSASDLVGIDSAQNNALLGMAGVQTIAQTLTAAKTAAHAALSTALASYSQGNYTAGNWTSLNAFKTTGDAAIDAALDLTGVETAKTTALNGMASVTTTAQALANAKSSAHTALNTALNTYVSTNYTAGNWTSLNAFKTTGDAAIDAALDLTGVETAKTTALNGMAGVATDLANAKSSAHAALNAAFGTYTQGNYTAENWASLVSYKSAGDTAIDNSSTLAGVTTAQDTAITGMAGVAIYVPPAPVIVPPAPVIVPQVLGVATVHPTTKTVTTKKGVYSYKLNGKTIKIKPFGTGYAGKIWAKKLDFGEDGVFYIFTNSDAYKKGQIRIYRESGKFFKAYNPYGAYSTQGLNATILVASNDKVYLVVGTKKPGTTAKTYQVTAKGLSTLNSIRTVSKKGNILVGFKKVYKNGYGLVTMKEFDQSTVKVWKFDSKKNKFVEDTKINKAKLKL